MDKEIENVKKDNEIKLKKKDEQINLLNNKIEQLEKQFNNKIKTREIEFNKKIEEKDKEIDYIKKEISEIKEKLMEEKNNEVPPPFICKPHPFSIDKSLILKNKIDGNIGINDLFEVYHLHNDENTVYIATKKKFENSTNICDKSDINILQINTLEDIQLLKMLEGHNKNIIFIKYFLDDRNKKDYLLSGDKENLLIVWEILDFINYQKVSRIKVDYGALSLMDKIIYNSLLLFQEKKNYIYIATFSRNYNQLYELEDGGYIKDVLITYNYKTLYLIKYKNSEHKNLIIDCCQDYIVIYNPFNEEIYAKIENEKTLGDNRHACIIYNKDNTDILSVVNENGFIILFDLKKKFIIRSYKVNTGLYNIIDWNYNFLIFTQYDEDSLGIIHLENRSIGKKIKCEKNSKCIKNILLNKNQELIITSGQGSNSILILFSSLIQQTSTPLSINNDIEFKIV